MLMFDKNLLFEGKIVKHWSILFKETLHRI